MTAKRCRTTPEKNKIGRNTMPEFITLDALVRQTAESAPARVAVAPLAPSSTPHDFAAMVKDSGARLLFMDGATAAAMATADVDPTMRRIALDGGDAGRPFRAWCAVESARPTTVQVDPEWVFNIIYSSGTT